MDIEKVLDLENGDEVDELHGTVTSVYDRNSGKRGKRKWTVQNFMLEDSVGDEIKIGAWNMDDLSELEDQTITLKRDMHFKDKDGYQSVELGENTKIIEEGAAEKSPSRSRKSGSREKSKTTNDKSSTSSDRQNGMHWGACLKVAGMIFTGHEEVDAGTVIAYTRELYNAQPGTPPQDKVRKGVDFKKAAAKHRAEKTREQDPGEVGGEPSDDESGDDEVEL